ncbi:hypothetical protein O181_050521 [Austropuccinia psidii MF-1]|uniref:Uncharacterized protein n=1 Tax=Austropuccinia psidii MF-1 TaxID=1389203 RepID=A0A9Q3HMF9_9BASI|nr:hypothetical protein [Austropuccinia psidii MF-1]
MSPVHLRNHVIARNQPEDRQGIFMTRRSGCGHHIGLQNTEKDMDHALQLQQVLKDLFQWSMDKKRLKLPSHWKALGEGLQKICVKEMPLKANMVITKGCNPNRPFKLLEERAARIRENPGTIKAIEGKLNQTDHTLIP